jgi:hypothetical protein
MATGLKGPALDSMESDKIPLIRESGMGKYLLFLGCAALSLVLGSPSPGAAEEVDCAGSPSQAIRILPAPLRKWGHIFCTDLGHTLASREGWVWAWLDGTGSVAIPSQMVRRNPAQLGNESYFVNIEVSDLEGEGLLGALSIFNNGLDINQGEVHGYRVDLTSVSGRSTTFYFLEFDTFAGGIWCPEGSCLPQWRFMIMERDHKADQRAGSI